MNLPKTSDVMSKKPITATRETPLKTLVSLMAEKSVGSIIIEDHSTPIGIVTERELLKELATYREIRANLKAGDVMSKTLVKLSPDTNIEEAAKTMISEKGRLVVVKGDKLVGVVTASDLVRGFSESEKDAPLPEDVVSSRIITLSEENTVYDAINVMHDNRVGSIIVTKGDKPAGIFTERDLITKVLSRKGLDTKLGVVQSKPLITARDSVTLRGAAEKMRTNKIKRLPLMKRDKLVGIVTARDLVEASTRI